MLLSRRRKVGSVRDPPTTSMYSRSVRRGVAVVRCPTEDHRRWRCRNEPLSGRDCIAECDPSEDKIDDMTRDTPADGGDAESSSAAAAAAAAGGTVAGAGDVGDCCELGKRCRSHRRIDDASSRLSNLRCRLMTSRSDRAW